MLMFRVLLMIVLTCGVHGLLNRQKRVVQGTRVGGRSGPYDSVRYSVMIGTLHGSKWWTLGFRSWLSSLGIYGTLHCGGSLITPIVIETACHCVALFTQDGEPVVLSHWERTFVNYVGLNNRFGAPSTESMMTRPPLKSKTFFIHEKCQQIQNESYSHDVGFVVVDGGEWIRGETGVPTNAVQFTPLYTVEEMTKTYEYFHRHLPVCLVVGWGDIKFKRPVDSGYMRSGWISLMDDPSCEALTTKEIKEIQGDAKELKSWVCMVQFPKYFQPVGKGDSGGPCTCEDVLFGLVGFLQGTPRFSGIDAFIYTTYQNAYDYRESFELKIHAMIDEEERRRIRDVAFWKDVNITGSAFDAPFRQLGRYETSSSTYIQVPLDFLLMFIPMPYFLLKTIIIV